MELPVPEPIGLVEHALSRVARKGLLAELAVEGAPNPTLFREAGCGRLAGTLFG